MQLHELTSYLETIAPLHVQESYDNSGLQTGYPTQIVTGILITLDVTEAVLDEAIARNCNVVVSHHPVLFKPVKKLTGSTYVERIVVKAIQHQIALYAIHTNLDNIWQGVSHKIAQNIGLNKLQILAPNSDSLRKLTVFVPKSHQEAVANALHTAGAGAIGNYTGCSFRVEGVGTFTPNESANPFDGQSNVKSYVDEVRMEFLLPTYSEKAVLKAMYLAHPYEEVAYFLQNLLNKNQEIGSGIIGTLTEPIPFAELIRLLKAVFKTPIIRHNTGPDLPIKRIAVCGGTGSFLIKHAMASGADAFITADVKYHEWFDADSKMWLADIGHYESEQFTKELLHETISKKFTNIAVLLSNVVTNPVQYS